jgi:hypothetical protein
MRWLGLLHGFFQRIGNASGFPRCYQFIALLLCFPCFYASEFFFKRAYFFNHCRLIRIGRKCATLGGQNGVLKLNNLSLDIRDRFELKEALRDVTSELEAGNRALYESYVHMYSPDITNERFGGFYVP